MAAATRKPREASPEGSPTRELILDTAEGLFAARGVDGVAVRDLAREMGITASSLYNHFPSKQALYDAVVERGLGPIVELVAAAWQPGALRADQVRGTLDRLTAHLACHPHLARLLQRALLEDTGTVEALLERWVGSLYREGMAVVGEVAEAAGWESAEVPHLGVALFGMIFAYFTYPGTLRRLAGWNGDPLSARGLIVQQRFLAEAVLRLLGPRSGSARCGRTRMSRTRARSSSDGRRRATHG